MPSIILASASPRRQELLNQIGVSYSVQAADIDESVHPDETPDHYVNRIATAKSLRVQQTNTATTPILAADTSVVLNNKILGKPENKAHAIEMLLHLSGCTHQVYTAVSLRAQSAHWQCMSVTEVTFRALTLEEIVAYWATGEPQDKAGSYAIQGLASIFVSNIQGSFSGVVGLPIYETASLLKHVGINILHD